jgi:hypothetical protein
MTCGCRTHRRLSSQGIPFSLFGPGKFHLCVYSPTFVRMFFDHHPTTRSDLTPFPHEARSAEKIAVNGNPVVAAHIACEVNPSQMQMGWEDFELRTHIEHVVILPDLYTISGRMICFHRDLTLKRLPHLLEQDALAAELTSKFTA